VTKDKRSRYQAALEAQRAADAEAAANAPVPLTDDERATGLLVVDGLAKDYGDLVALTTTFLSVPPGQSVALVGHNGSGKSTLLRIVAGLLDPSEGSATVEGAPVGTSEARAATSFIPDEPVLFDDLSVREHLEYVSAVHGAPAPAAEIDELVGRLGLTARVDDLPARFSRGLRQKAGLAVGLIRPFSLLLVDEPFVGLDAPGREALLELLTEASAAGATLVIATHEPSFVERVDRCIALRDGRIVHDGPAVAADVLRLVGT
jgi:ABC-type multidrug transport system ATPase subunit